MDRDNYSRRDFIRTGGAAAVGLGALLAGCKTGGKALKRPNIIFIMADDHAAQAVSSYGSLINKTPNIDRLATEGIRFTNSFCTNSICAPCRAVLMTGKYSHLNGVKDNGARFDGSQLTFPKLMQQNGYETAMIGKWHLKSDPTGFDYWNVLPGQGDYYNPVLIEMGERKRHNGYVTDLVTDFALDWMKKREKENPFCMLLHHKAPHRNWMPPEEHLTKYDGGDVPEPGNLFDDYESRSDASREQTMSIARDLVDTWDLKIVPEADPENLRGIDKSYVNKLSQLDEKQRRAWDAAYEPKNEKFKQAALEGDDLVRWKYQRYIKDYLRCITSIDDNVGRLLDFLDQNNLADNTLVVYTSDQGFYLGEHGWFDKRFMYEESLRMPLLARLPGMVKAGTVSDDIVLNLDFAETFLDLAGISVPDEMQGQSLKPLLKGKSPADWRQSMYYHYYEYPAVHMVKRHYGVRTQRHKLIHYYNDIDAWELYDLKEDPAEMNNLYGKPGYETITEELKKELYRLQEHYKEEKPEVKLKQAKQ